MPGAKAEAAIRMALADLDLEIDQPQAHTFVVTLPGEHKLTTNCALVVGSHTVTINAFVARRPDENHADVYRMLLERNARLTQVAFALDRLGDIYLVGRIPVASVTPEMVDAVLGAVLDASDSMFDRILTIGFATSIRREWAWRVDRGESVDNLLAFQAALSLGED